MYIWSPFFHAIHYSCLILQRVVIRSNEAIACSCCYRSLFLSLSLFSIDGCLKSHRIVSKRIFQLRHIFYIYQMVPRNQINTISGEEKTDPSELPSAKPITHKMTIHIDCYHLEWTNFIFTYQKTRFKRTLQVLRMTQKNERVFFTSLPFAHSLSLCLFLTNSRIR